MDQNNNAKRATWPESLTLYQPCEVTQGLLHENASCLAVQTYLKMGHLPFTVKIRSNAEFMANGRLTKLPLLLDNKEVLAEFIPIAMHVNDNLGVSLRELEDELWAYVTWIENTFTMAEIYVCFMDKNVYNNVTVPRIACAHPWPLHYLLVRAKRRQYLSMLKTYQWYDMTNEDVIEKLEKCCESLTEKLTESGQLYFGGDRPCELDAIVFGHMFTIITTNLSNEMLARTLTKFKKLIDLCSLIDGKYFNVDTNKQFEL